MNYKDKVKEIINKEIVNTQFYKDLKSMIREYLELYDNEVLIIKGEYGIGKTESIKKILREDLKKKFILITNRLEYKSDIIKFLEVIEEHKDINIIIIDDSFISKRVENMLFDLANKDYKIIIVINSLDEVKNTRKLIGRAVVYNAVMTLEDLEYLKSKIEEAFNIDLSMQDIYNLRSLIKSTISILKNMKDVKTEIERLAEEVSKEENRKKKLRYILENLKKKGYKINYELFETIAIKVLGYSPNYVKKKLYLEYIDFLKKGGNGVILVENGENLHKSL